MANIQQQFIVSLLELEYCVYEVSFSKSYLVKISIGSLSISLSQLVSVKLRHKESFRDETTCRVCGP